MQEVRPEYSKARSHTQIQKTAKKTKKEEEGRKEGRTIGRVVRELVGSQKNNQEECLVLCSLWDALERCKLVRFERD